MKIIIDSCLSLAVLCGALSAALPAAAAKLPDVLERPASLMRHPERGVLLAAARAGDRVVAAGERGLVALSDDNGMTWRQAKVPVSVTLTGIAFPTANHGWAIGHSGIVLHSTDGGETWERRLDGVAAAQIVLDAANEHSDNPKLVAAASQFVKDGPDKPFLDLFFEDEHNGIVVGAYGLVLQTEDGGRSWKSWFDRVPNPRGLHIYAVRRDGDRVYLAGEQGLFAGSQNGGKTFERISTGYEGTYFALTLTLAGELILTGLRGNGFWSADHGTSFQKAATALPISFERGLRLVDGRLVFVNQAGGLLVSNDGGRSLTPLANPHGPPLTTVVQAADGVLIGFGFGGSARLPNVEPSGAGK